MQTVHLNQSNIGESQNAILSFSDEAFQFKLKLTREKNIFLR